MSTEPVRWIEYALGLLDADAQRAADAELETSATARAALSDAMDSLSAIGSAEAPLQPSDGLRAAVLAAVRPERRFEGFVDRVSTFLDLSTARVREILSAVDVATDPDGGWEDDRVLGTRLYHFSGGPRVAEADCGIVRLEPGARYPAHRHIGDEWSFILSGMVEEDSGDIWGPGDVVHCPPGSVHSFWAAGDEPLVFALVLHGGLESPRKPPSDG